MSIDITRKKTPSDLLKIVKCGSQTYFTQKNCTWRQYGIVPTSICSSCKSASCLIWEQISCSDAWLGYYIPLTFIKRSIAFNTFNILFVKIFISWYKVRNRTHYVLIKVLEYLQKTKTLKITFFLDQSFGIGLK